LSATGELDNTRTPARTAEQSHVSDVPAASAPSAAQTESLALMKANSQAKPFGDVRANFSEHLEIPPIQELAWSAQTGDVAEAHDRLIESATKSFNGDAKTLAAFENNMSTLETRMKSSAPEDVVKTYAEVKRLLDTSSTIVSDKQRGELACDVMERAAHPLSSNQGESLDCAAASIENLLYSKSPALAAGYVADVALTGKFKDETGNVVSVDKNTIAIPQGAISDGQIKEGMEPRSHGDQVIQAVIRNEELALVNAKNGVSSDGKKGLKYEVKDAIGFNETGEYVTDYSKKPPMDVTSDWNGMQGDNIADVAKALDAKNSQNEKNVFLRWSSVANVDQFKSALANPEPAFPRLLGINVAQEPFKSTMDVKDEDGVGFHAITLVSYDAKTNLIHYRNPDFASRDMTVDVDKMYNAMLIHREDDDLKVVGDELRNNHAKWLEKPEAASDDVYAFLQATEAAQRNEALQKVSKESGIDLAHLLSEQQKSELGVFTVSGGG
jgi:hypothetical protein